MDALFTIRFPALVTSTETQLEPLIGSHPTLGVSESSDEALLSLICEGDKEALAALFRRYARIVRGVAYRVLRDVSEADDLLQDVFLLIHGSCAAFDISKGSARFWILQTTYRRAISRRRYLMTRHFYQTVGLEEVEESLEAPLAQGRGLEATDGMLSSTVLEKAFATLSDDQRQTLRLHFMEGYTLSEIAAKLGQSIGNVRHHYIRGLERLRKRILGGKLPSPDAV